MLRALFASLVVLWAFDAGAQAAAYYIAPDGDDNNAGTSAAPWATWTKAFTTATAGTTIYVKPGSWVKGSCGASDPTPCAASAAMPKVSCDASIEPNWPIGVDGTESNPIRVVATTERGSYVRSDGKDYAFAMKGCSWWTIDGIRLEGGDAKTSEGGFNRDTFFASDSDHLTIRRLLLTYNNRYFNDHLMRLTRVNDSTLVENEGYYFHRHGISLNDSHRVSAHRNYFNSRSHADLPPDAGAYDSHDNAPGWGDEAIVWYFSDNGYGRNNIAEYSEGFSLSGSFGVLEGNIALNGTFGIYSISNCQDPPSSQECDTDLERHTVGSIIKNNFVDGTTYAGIWCKTSDCIVENNTVMNSDLWSYLTTDSVALSGYDSRVTYRNNIAHTGVMRGYEVVTDEDPVQQWSGNNLIVYEHANKTIPYPDAGVPWSNIYEEDPGLGTCRVYTPRYSRARTLGAGANIILTEDRGPLWNPVSGAFMWCGAIVAGVNDVAGASCFDVHERINVGVNGCPVPNASLAP